jgi:alpha-glucuronidase
MIRRFWRRLPASSSVRGGRTKNYTGPLGLQTLTDIVGNHFGVCCRGVGTKWLGTMASRRRNGIGMDRSVATGTGFSGQYRPDVARIYESVESTPDDLLLFFHHVPYTRKLRSGKTVIQFIYDSHLRRCGGGREVRERVESIKGTS